MPSLPRKAFHLATKVGRYEPEVDKMFDFRAERVIRSVDESLQRLGLEYVDVIQVCNIIFWIQSNKYGFFCPYLDVHIDVDVFCKISSLL